MSKESVKMSGMQVSLEFSEQVKQAEQEYSKIYPNCVKTGWKKREKEGTLNTSGFSPAYYEKALKEINWMKKLAGIDIDQRHNEAKIFELESTVRRLKMEIAKLQIEIFEKDELISQIPM
jgi:hypothetical protein